MLDKPTKHRIEVNVAQLENLLKDDIHVMIKIDVEGYEDHVLAGAKTILANNQLQALIIEMENKRNLLNPTQTCHEMLLEKGFSAHSYDPSTR
jgi:hypothetical protein